MNVHAMLSVNALIVAILFVIVSLPKTYELTSNLWGGITSNGRPSLAGIAIHGLVAGLLYMAVQESRMAIEKKIDDKSV